MYAVIEKNGHQYKIEQGKEYEFDSLPLKEGSTFMVKEVLLLVDNNNVVIGQPYIQNAEVSFKVIKHIKGDKVKVLRFKAKSRYTKRTGIRPKLTRALVESIKADGFIKKESLTQKPRIAGNKRKVKNPGLSRK